MTKLCLLDPGLQTQAGAPSDNLGDLVIQDAVNNTLCGLFPGAQITRYSTHEPLTDAQLHELAKAPGVIVGGTNLLSSKMRPYNRWSEKHRCWSNQWSIDLLQAMRIRGKAILLGAGWRQYQGAPDFFSGLMYRTLLHPGALHSVRDEYSRTSLQQAGVANVANTACVTMWGFTDEGLAAIPTRKASVALLMLTDYSQRPEIDGPLLRLMERRYDHIYAWPQGTEDRAYLESLNFAGTLLDRSLEGLDGFVRGDIPFDYIGTRLHGGIRCLQSRRRSLILEIDNRAAEIARDTGLPTLPRDDFKAIEGWIDGSAPVSLRLPRAEMERWKQTNRALLAA